MLNLFKFKSFSVLSLILTILFTFSLIFKPELAFAGGACSNGGCYNNVTCVWVTDPSVLPLGGYYTVGTEPCGSAAVGGVAIPPAVAKLNLTSSIGLLTFFSRLLSFGAVIGGIIVVANFVGAGLMYVTGAGNADTHIKVRDKITYSVIGIIIIVSAYTIVGLMGLIFFKDATFLLNPRLQGIL